MNQFLIIGTLTCFKEMDHNINMATTKFKKDDLTAVAIRRKLPFTESALRSMKVGELTKIVGAFSEAEKAALSDLKTKREAFKSMHGKLKRSDLEGMLKRASIPYSDLGVDAMIDKLIEHKVQDIIIDPSQMDVIKRSDDQLLLISAGPGSGKTTTLCYFVQCLGSATDRRKPGRTLMLAFNRVARETLTKRLKSLGVHVINKAFIKPDDCPAHGVAVLTFHEFSYRVHFDTNICSQSSSYTASLEEAARLIREGKYGTTWDNLVIDEAQDVSGNMVGIIEGLRRQPNYALHSRR
jgi:hypothetical protein